MEKYFTLVEGVLDKFPLECKKNYYQNKTTLQISKEEVVAKGIYGIYDDEENIITLYREDALPHELIHMAFRDKDKVDKKIYEEEDIFYGNGVSFSVYRNGRKIVYAKGFTEGMAEYLTRKTGICIGKHFQYYFMDLLISIYGEDIIEYALNNDPVGFFSDSRWKDIYKYELSLDKLDTSIAGVKIISEFKDKLNNTIENGTMEERYNCCKWIFEIKNDLKSSIVELFELIIEEYNHCENPVIDACEFYDKLNNFLVNKDYSFIFHLDNEYFSVKEEIEKIIRTFCKNNKLIRKRCKR